MVRLIILSIIGFLCCLTLGIAAPTKATKHLLDPTTPSSYQDYDLGHGGLILHSIFIYHNKRRVIINNTQLMIGDSIANNRIIRIDQDSVTLRGPDGKFILPLVIGVEKQYIKPQELKEQ